MEIGAVAGVEAFGEEMAGLVESIATISSRQGEEVELELNAHVAETMVVRGVHIGVTLGMSQHERE